MLEGFAELRFFSCSEAEYGFQGSSILHQIIEIRSDGVFAKGINNEAADPFLVEWIDIEAVVVAIIY